MKTSDLEAPRLYAFADFKTLLGLEETAALISARLLEGIQFVVKEDLRDEVPAMSIGRCVLGFWFVLIDQNPLEAPYPGPDELKTFTLEMGQDDIFANMYSKLREDRRQSIDLGHWLAAMLFRIPEFNVVDCSPAGSIVHKK
jgi:hypothetical protein